MKAYRCQALLSGICASLLTATAAAVPPDTFTWSTVVNNGDYMPTDSCDPTNPPTPAEPTCRNFNSYNQPSVSADQLVVIRARSKGADGGAGESVGAVDNSEGGNQPVHGVYTRDMAAAGPVVRILDRDTLVPQPNNLGDHVHRAPVLPAHRHLVGHHGHAWQP